MIRACMLLSMLLAAEAGSLSTLSSTELRGLASSPQTWKGDDPDANRLKFYGKIQTNCEFDDCFSAVVTTGRTNFQGDGGDLANIYVPPNDYDTWKQYISAPSAIASAVSPVEGEFTYQLKNETLSCMVIELRWAFAPSRDDNPTYSCAGTPIALNWDCHLDWALTTECSYNTMEKQVEALFTVTNLGPESEYGEGTVIVVNQRDDEEPVVTTFTV